MTDITAYDSAIGVDLGGTRIKAGAVDRDGRVVARVTIDTEADGGPDHVIDRIVAVIEELLDTPAVSKAPMVGVGIGAPGALSQSRGVVISPPNLPGWREVAIATKVGTRVKLPILLENDANCAAVGESLAGAGRGIRDLVMFTLGTGVGSGIILEGRLLRGHFESAGELGHTIVQPDGRACLCGQRGCLEAYASAGHIARRVREAMEAGETSSLADTLAERGEIDAQDVAAASEHDVLAGRIWDDACRYLAIACVNAQHAMNPQRVILGGGMSAAGDRLLTPVREHFNRLTWPGVNDRPEIVLASLGDDAGLIGAAAVMLSKAGTGDRAPGRAD